MPAFECRDQIILDLVQQPEAAPAAAATA